MPEATGSPAFHCVRPDPPHRVRVPAAAKRALRKPARRGLQRRRARAIRRRSSEEEEGSGASSPLTVFLFGRERETFSATGREHHREKKDKKKF